MGPVVGIIVAIVIIDMIQASVRKRFRKNKGKPTADANGMKTAEKHGLVMTYGEVVEDNEAKEVSLPDHPIPCGKEEVDLWTGSLNTEFSYEAKGKKKVRYKVKLIRIFVTEIFHIHIECVDPETGEVHNFEFSRIVTMIVAKGMGRLDRPEFLRRLGIDVDLYYYMWDDYDTLEAVTKHCEQQKFNSWRKTLETIWSADEEPLEITFTYYTGSDQHRRTINLSRIKKSEYGKLYLEGFCQMRNEFRIFNVEKIGTKITMADGTKLDIEEFMEDRLRIVPLAS